MKHREAITEIMTSHVLTVSPQEALQDVVELIRKNRIRHVPVVENDRVVGIISRTDINRLRFSPLFEGQEDADEAVLSMLTISQVMTHNPRVIRTYQTIWEVAEAFTEEEFHALPVVDTEGRLAGIITTTDLIRYLLDKH